MEYDYTTPIDLDKLSDDLHTEKETFVDNGKQVINNINVYNIT
jgi:hypothetical protein